MLEFGDWDDDQEDDPAEADLDENYFTECSECGASIYEDAEICPSCGSFQISDTRPWSHKPYWKLGVVLSILAIVSMLLFFFLTLYGPRERKPDT